MAENRQYHRTPINLSIIYVGMNHKDQVEIQGVGRALDVSPKGLMFESTEPIYVKKLNIRAPTDQGNSIEISGQVIYSMPHSPGIYRTGVQFAAAAEKMRAFVAELTDR